MFWVYRYKGFSFTAARTVHTALVLAGQQGCSQADTGHLLLALVQTAQGTAADFLRRKRVTSTALAEHTAAHAAGRPRRLHSRDLAPELSKAMEFAVLGAHAASAARAMMSRVFASGTWVVAETRPHRSSKIGMRSVSQR